jgi:serine/threonine protein kinase
MSFGKRIGRGEMADVCEGHDRLLGRVVSIEVLATAFVRERGFVERFRREAGAAARINHRNLVAVFDTNSHDVPGSRRWLVCVAREASSSRYVCPWPFWA